MLKPLRILVLAVALLGAVPAGADIIQFTAPLGLTGDQEIPPRATPATGTGWAEYNTDTHELTVHLEWMDLLDPAAASHIHVAAAAGENGPVAVDFVPVGFPNVVSGSFTHTFNLDDSASYGAGFLGSFGGDVNAARLAVLAGMVEGRSYFNIHTPTFPPGEIRGNISLVPEPTTMALLGLGAAAAFLRRRRA